MDKIYFIGIHNKAGMKPLDSRTASGKIIDKVISELSVDSEKLNLFNCNEIPSNINDHIERFISTHDVNMKCVLLGKQVQKYISNYYPNSISVNHPGYYLRRGNVSINNYVTDLVNILCNNLNIRTYEKIHTKRN